MKYTVLVSSLAVGIALVCATTLQAAQPPTAEGYAEGIYTDYSTAAKQEIRFEVKTIDSGSLKELAGKSFADVVGAPRHLVEADEDRFTLVKTRFNDDIGKYDRTELDGGVEGFDVVGLPAHLGHYRTLSVNVSIGNKSRKHQAIEMCWDTLEHCVVLDPSMVFIDSIVNNRRLAQAAGYGPRIQLGSDTDSTGDGVGIKATCGLASAPWSTWKTLTWAAWTQRYKNIYGMTLVTKNLGGQQSGIRCNSYCNPAPYGYSSTSSASGTLGYDTACANAYNYGSSGRTGRWVAQTKCTHKWSGDASATVTRSGSGSGVTLSWNTNGGVDSNGGYFTDTCGYF